MNTWFDGFIELFFSLGLFINAALFIPQAIRLYKQKDSRELSIITFGGFSLIQLFTVLHAYLVKDYLLFGGFLFAFITCGSVTFLIIYYRLKRRTQKINRN